jgi:hypothetical protein
VEEGQDDLPGKKRVKEKKKKGTTFAFLSESRDAKRLREAKETKDYSHVIYNPSRAFIQPSSVCMVQLKCSPTLVKHAPFKEVCSKGETECRHSN